MAEKVTIMVLKVVVDLQCTKCCKKVKDLLCKFPQIRDQVYDEKANTVKITVVCCSPEKFRDKLCCKGRGTIKSIDIREPPPDDPPEPPPGDQPQVDVNIEVTLKPDSLKPPLYPAYGVCFVPCYVGLPGGSCNCSCGGGSVPALPCNCGCGGRSVPAPPCDCGCGGRSVCYDGYGRGYTERRCDLYVIEENPTGCTVM